MQISSNNTATNNVNEFHSASGIDDEKLVMSFVSYEDYLDSLVSPNHRKLLGDNELARKLVEYGFQGSHVGSDVMSRQQFYQKKAQMAEMKLQNALQVHHRQRDSEGHNIHDNQLLEALHARESEIHAQDLVQRSLCEWIH